MGILSGFKNKIIAVKTREINEELDIFEVIDDKYVVYEMYDKAIDEITEMFNQIEIEKKSDENYIREFSKESTIKLFNLLTNIEMDEYTYDRFSKKSNARLMAVKVTIEKLLTMNLNTGNTDIENNKRLGVESKPKNRNDKPVILEQWKEKEAERKAQEVVDKGIENGHIVEVGSDHIAEVSKKVDAMTDDELNAELARLEKIAKIKKLQAELGE